MSDTDKEFYTRITGQLAQAEAANKSSTMEYVKLSEKHSALMKELKATRDQRLDRIKDNAENFIELIKTLNDREINKEKGRQAELMRMAMDKEHERLAQYHTYVDGTVEQPILSAETLKMRKDKEKDDKARND